MSKNATISQPHPETTSSGFGQRLKPPVPDPASRTVGTETRKMFALISIR
jgi:hypothetical protein